MFENNDSEVIFTFSKKFLYVVLFLLLSAIFFIFPSLFRKSVPEINKNTSLSADNVDIYLESILEASKSNDVVKNKGFSEIIDYVYQNILKDYSEKLKFTAEDREKVFNNYYSERSKVINNIHDTMVSREAYSDKKEYQYKYLDSINGFSESLSAFACGVLSVGLGEIAQDRFVKNIITDYICKDILIEIVSPVTQILKDRAIVKDVNNITFNMKERIRSSILQLATSRDIYRFDIKDEYIRVIDPFKNTRFDFLKKNIKSERRSEVRAAVKAAAIAGFDLKDLSMNVNHAERTLSIYLPSPEVISSNIAVEFTGEDSQILAPKIDYNLYNNISEKAMVQLKEEVKKNDLFQMAKENAMLAINNIFQPLMSMPQFNYEVKIYFDNKEVTMEKHKD